MPEEINKNNSFKKINFIFIGLEEKICQVIEPLISYDFCSLVKQKYDLDEMMNLIEPHPAAVFCGIPPDTLSAIEVAQMMRMQYQNSYIYYISFMRTGYNRDFFRKNGFTDSFFLPFDFPILNKEIINIFNENLDIQNDLNIYRSVKLIDLDPETPLTFDTSLYLPLNNKYIKYSIAGECFSSEKIEKLKKNQMGSLYIKHNQIKNFYKYTANLLKKFNSISSATERKEKLQHAIREMIHGIFNDYSKESSFENGQLLLQDCQLIVKQFILNSDLNSKNLYSIFLNTMGEESNTYSHAGNVSTYAVLFSLGLQIGDPSEIAIAGMLHDIGLMDVPSEILEKSPAERTKEGEKIYNKHPEYSVNILKMRKIILPEKITKAILQHHERFNGSGYPHKNRGSKICQEAQIIALADQFDYMTTLFQGKPKMNLDKCILFFKNQLNLKTEDMIFDPDLLNSLLKILV